MVKNAAPSTEAQIVEAEATLGHRLPDDFRWFSRTYGDGYFNTFETSVELDDGTVVAIDRLGGAAFLPHQGGWMYCPPNFPPGLVRCADTIMGEVYILRLEPPHNGSVWFWGVYEGRGGHDLVKVADSFADLVACVIESPPEP